MSFSLTGIASGLDTATIVSQLMQLEKIPYTKLETKQSTLNSQLSAVRSINTKLNTLRSAAEDLLLKSNFNLRSASNSDESVVKATVSEYAAETTYQINVTQLATQHIVKSKAFDNNSTLTGTIEINGHKFILANAGDEPDAGENETVLTIEPDMTYDQVLTKLMDAVNDKKLGVKASLVSTTPDSKTLVLTSEKFGAANKITFNEGGTFDLKPVDGSGQNAVLTINGIDIEASSNDLSNVITGLSLTLHKIGESTITVTKDADKIAEKVEAFVKAYNDVITTIKSNTAKGKTLQGDATLRSLESYLNGIFNREVGDENSSGLRYLFEIGLEIDKGVTSSSSMTGTIKFDKENFKAALAEKPDEVYQLFAMDDADHPNKSGIARQFKDSLMEWTRSGSGILAAKIEGYDSQIAFVKKQMESMEARLTLKEEQLKKQFAAMETALASLQSQQSWLMSQISSLSLY